MKQINAGFELKMRQADFTYAENIVGIPLQADKVAADDRAGVLSGDRQNQDARRREEHARHAARRVDHDGDWLEGVFLRVVVAAD
ncbi:hypothetical protein [Burkholderia ubonensis]|uniref:hypothetical protein n=1 Tax=Burkholderia ubonensis TaxID=101571 RepID=UPI001E5575B5|nr:hypothetical protein [Burkholderia ubonensis]